MIDHIDKLTVRAGRPATSVTGFLPAGIGESASGVSEPDLIVDGIRADAAVGGRSGCKRVSRSSHRHTPTYSRGCTPLRQDQLQETKSRPVLHGLCYSTSCLPGSGANRFRPLLLFQKNSGFVQTSCPESLAAVLPASQRFRLLQGRSANPVAVKVEPLLRFESSPVLLSRILPVTVPSTLFEVYRYWFDGSSTMHTGPAPTG